MGTISLLAHAKINLTLDVAGRRDDGYHLLQSVMQSVSLADVVTVHRQKEGIAITADNPVLPTDGQNICWRAAAAFLRHIGISGGAAVQIEKRIPVAAGLGGGSSNAAAVLIGLNELFEGGLNLSQLQALGLTVGADVPFCLRGGTALVEGIGEKVTPLRHIPPVCFVLVKPQVSVSTGEIYQRFAPANYGGSFTRRFIDLLDAGFAFDILGGACGNVLETATIPLVPEIEVWKGRLLEQGALAALMTGSGPTVFGVFDGFDGEEKAGQFCLRWRNQAQLYLVRPVQCGVLSRRTEETNVQSGCRYTGRGSQ